MSLVIANESGTVTVPDQVLVGIAVRAAESVEGIRVKRRRDVDVEQRLVRLSVSATRAEPIVGVAERVQDAVAAMLKEMCGIETRVDVAVAGLA